MSRVTIPITLIILLTISAVFAGCGATVPGNIVTEEKDFTDFTYVDVGSAFEFEITRSDTFSVIISADESLFDLVGVSRSGETLKIYLNPRHIFTDFTLGTKTLKAEITMPALYGLQVSGASKGTITGFKSQHDLSLGVSGASSLDINGIEAGSMDFDISGASEVTGSVNATETILETSGGSKVELEGSASKILLKVSGASKIDLADFPLDSADVELSGASEATINVKGRLDTVLSGASRLYFHGNPTMGRVSVTGASTIKHE